ncbi:hypothetical protein MRX96_000182 [Rhipicephalus microplus]
MDTVPVLFPTSRRLLRRRITLRRKPALSKLRGNRCSSPFPPRCSSSLGADQGRPRSHDAARSARATPSLVNQRDAACIMWLLLTTLGAACLTAQAQQGDSLAGPEGGVPLGECVCVPYYQCKEGKVSEDGGGLLDARRKLPPKEEIPLDGLGDQNQQCPGVDQVCCAEPSAVTETPTGKARPSLESGHGRLLFSSTRVKS